MDLVECDKTYTLEGLRAKARAAGLQATGDKKSLCRRLIEANILGDEYTMKIGREAPDTMAGWDDAIPYFEEGCEQICGREAVHFPIKYTEWRADLYLGGRSLGHITYYSVPSLRIGHVEGASILEQARPREELLALERKVTSFALHHLADLGITNVYTHDYRGTVVVVV